AYEIAYTFVDFSAAGLFVVGSILFLSPATTYAATWLFIVGSVFFGLKPTIRLIRELKLVSLGEDDQVARRLDG
ncbi:MAG: YrhK family protein, partial [Rhodobacteraceae bacterium]|nr:YrhK family protein [Paracoccaceae bacterium]